MCCLNLTYPVVCYLQYFISPTGAKYSSMKAVKEAFGWLTPATSDDEGVPTPEQQSVAASTAEEASEDCDSEEEEEGNAAAGSQEAAPALLLLPEVEIVTGEEGEQTLFEE